MNIFWLDNDLSRAAMCHHDKHVVKMVLETAQILSTALHLRGVSFNGQYRPTHTKHPCVLWAAESNNNSIRLYNLGCRLLSEYTYRYGRVHKCNTVMLGIHSHLVGVNVDRSTPPPLCMPDEYKTDDIVESYRNYYRAVKIDGAHWTRRERPDWI